MRPATNPPPASAFDHAGAAKASATPRRRCNTRRLRPLSLANALARGSARPIDCRASASASRFNRGRLIPLSEALVFCPSGTMTRWPAAFRWPAARRSPRGSRTFSGRTSRAMARQASSASATTARANHGSPLFIGSATSAAATKAALSDGESDHTWMRLRSPASHSPSCATCWSRPASTISVERAGSVE